MPSNGTKENIEEPKYWTRLRIDSITPNSLQKEGKPCKRPNTSSNIYWKTKTNKSKKGNYQITLPLAHKLTNPR